MEDGSEEWFGLSKGVFTRPNKEGQTKEDGVEFGSDEIEGQFMEREVDGFNEELAVVMAYDEKGKMKVEIQYLIQSSEKVLIQFKTSEPLTTTTTDSEPVA